MNRERQPPAYLTLADLLADPSRSLDLEREQAVAMLAQVGALGEVLRARLAIPTTGAAFVAKQPNRALEKSRIWDGFLTLDEMVCRSRKSRGWFHAHWRKTFPTGVKKGRTVLVPEADFERWLRRP